MPRIFISYRRSDTAGHSGRLYDDLVDRFGARNVFMDVDGMRPGELFEDHLRKEVAEADVVVALIGPTWVGPRLHESEDYVALELEAALDQGKWVVPVLVGGAEPPKSADLPDRLQQVAKRHAIDLADHRWRADFERLVTALAPDGAPPPRARRAPASWPPWHAPIVLSLIPMALLFLLALAKDDFPRTYEKAGDPDALGSVVIGSLVVGAIAVGVAAFWRLRRTSSGEPPDLIREMVGESRARHTVAALVCLVGSAAVIYAIAVATVQHLH